MKHITASEASNLHFLALLEGGLAIITTLLFSISLVAYLHRNSGFSRALGDAFTITFILGAVYSAVVFIICLLVLGVRGASSARMYMRFQSFALYGYSILVLYLSGCGIYSAVVLAKELGSKPAVVLVGVFGAISTLLVLFVTVKIPYMMSFLKDIEIYPKGQELRLIAYLCGGGAPTERPRRASRRVVTLKTGESESDEEKGILQGK